MFKQTIIFLFVSMISLSSSAEEVKISKIQLRTGATSLPSGEKFFVVNKGSLLPDIHFSDIKSWEKRVGPLKNKGKPTRHIEVKKLPELGIKEGDKISFYNSKAKAIDNYVVKKEVAIQLIPSPYDSEYFYIGFNVSLVDSKNIDELSDSDYHEYDGLGYLGSRYELNSTDLKGPESEIPVVDNTDANRLLTQLNLGMKDKIKVSEVTRSGKKVIIFYKPMTGERSYFLKISPSEFIQWDQPKGEFESIHQFGDFVKGCEFTLVYENEGTYYLVLLFRDKIEKYKVFYDRGYKG